MTADGEHTFDKEVYIESGDHVPHDHPSPQKDEELPHGLSILKEIEKETGVTSQNGSIHSAHAEQGRKESKTECTITPTEDVEAQNDAPPSQPIHTVFTKRQKIFICFMVSWATFFSPLSANIYFPALTSISAEYKISNELTNLTITTYMILQGIAPTFFGDAADQFGRRPLYIIGFIIYIGACIGIALQHNYAALLVLRCVQSSGSSGTVAMASGVIADIATSAERGTYMGWMTTPSMLAPALGPLIGGVISQLRGWHAIFWFLTIFASVYLIPFLLFFPETGRNVVGDGSIPPQGWNMSLLNWMKVRKAEQAQKAANGTTHQQPSTHLVKKRKRSCPNPMASLRVLMQPDVAILLFYNSLVYVAFYCVLTSIPYLFAEIYHLDNLQVGLCFLPVGAGASLSPSISGRMLDRNYARHARRLGLPLDRKRTPDLRNFPIEDARIQVSFTFLYIGLAAVLCFGWTLQVNAPLAAPLVMEFLVGFFLTGFYNACNTLLVDLYPMSPATAVAANNLVRCLMGAGGVSVIVQIINTMGRGGAFSFVAGVCLVTSPMMNALQKWGPGWREARRLRIEERKRRAEEKEEMKEKRRDEKTQMEASIVSPTTGVPTNVLTAPVEEERATIDGEVATVDPVAATVVERAAATSAEAVPVIASSASVEKS